MNEKIKKYCEDKIALIECYPNKTHANSDPYEYRAEGADDGAKEVCEEILRMLSEED